MFEKGLFPLLLQLNEPVYGYPSRGYWLDMGTPEKYLRLNHDLLLAKAKSALTDSLSGKEVYCDEGVLLHPSARITGPAVIGSRSKICKEARIKGPTVIGSDCLIGEGASIEATVLWRKVNVVTGASLKQCIVAGNTEIKSNEQVANSVITPNHGRITCIESLEKPIIADSMPADTTPPGQT